MKLAHNRARTVPLMEIVGGMAFAAVLLIAAIRLNSGDMTIGALVGIIGAIAIATPSARALGQSNTLFNEASAALSRIFGLIDEPVEILEQAERAGRSRYRKAASASRT